MVCHWFKNSALLSSWSRFSTNSFQLRHCANLEVQFRSNALLSHKFNLALLLCFWFEVYVSGWVMVEYSLVERKRTREFLVQWHRYSLVLNDAEGSQLPKTAKFFLLRLSWIFLQENVLLIKLRQCCLISNRHRRVGNWILRSSGLQMRFERYFQHRTWVGAARLVYFDFFP